MRILVLGAGTVGTSIADLLCQHRHSVTVVDNDEEQAQKINEELDVKVVVGSASQSSVLFQAGVFDCEICLAVTGNDEVNIVAAKMAKSMGARRSIARVYAPIFRDSSTFDYQTEFNIDRLLSLEHLTAMEFARAIRNPGSVVLEHFARGEIEVQEIIVNEKSAITGVPLVELALPRNVRVASLYRSGQTWIAGAGDTIEIGDHVTLIGRREDIARLKSQLKIGGQKQTVVIGGGGETGLHLARTLESQDFAITLLENDPDRCEYLAKTLNSTTVLQADVTSRAVLEEEQVGRADVFVACTGNDENNIVAGVEARDVGTKVIMAVVGREDYSNIVGKCGIDLAIGEREAMASQILGFVNSGPVVSRTSLVGGSLTACEIDVWENSLITKKELAELNLPSQCLIAAVIRGEQVYVPGAKDQIQVGDTVVVLVDDAMFRETVRFFVSKGRRQ